MPQPPRSRVTLAAVAAATGLSVATASRALAGRGDLAPDTRARVLAAARRLGYTRAGEARGRPRSGTARLIDLVLGHFHDPYSDEVTAGARGAAAAAGFDLVLTAERDRPNDDWPARIRARGSAGVVLGLVVPTAGQLAQLRDASIPAVLLDPRSARTPALPSVHTTDRLGGAAAAEHLIASGATAFLVVTGTPAYRFGRARIEGFVTAVRRQLPDAVIQRVDADWTGRTTRRRCAPVVAAVRAGERLGVFACADTLAAGVYAAAADAGKRIPQDILVVGFDDVRTARALSPALTTIHQPIREMAAAAIEMLTRAASGEELAAEPTVLPTRLVARASTGGPSAPA